MKTKKKREKKIVGIKFFSGKRDVYTAEGGGHREGRITVRFGKHLQRIIVNAEHVARKNCILYRLKVVICNKDKDQNF